MEPITKKSIGLDGRVFEERRGALRHRVFKGGTLRFNRGYGALECTVRNLSDNGARLSFGDTTAVPASFDFWLSGSDRPVSASIRWRNLNEIGVVFDA